MEAINAVDKDLHARMYPRASAAAVPINLVSQVDRQKLALDEQQSKRDTTVRRRQQPATHASWAYLFGGLFST